eukprot:jgi/Hompol1/1808/HPOL_001615-RA
MKSSAALNAAPLAIFSYCVSSILMTVTNKLVLSTYDIKLNFLLLAIQSAMCVVLLETCVGFGILSHRPFRVTEAKNWFLVSLALVMMIYTGSKALQYLSIPVFTIFKNLTIILTAYSERILLNGSPVTRLMLISFFLIVMSSVVAGWADIASGNTLKQSAQQTSVAVAYGWMFANCLTTTSFGILMKGKLKASGFKDFDTVFYNNLLSVPTLLILFLFNELPEAARVYNRYYGAQRDENASEFYGLVTGLIVNSVSAFGISYCTSWCFRVTSSTTFSMAGALNKLPIAVAGMIFFDAVVNFASVSGVLLAFAGGIVYSVAKNQQTAAAAAHASATVASLLPVHNNGGVSSNSAASGGIGRPEGKE